MAEVTSFPFASLEELRARWPDLPPGSEPHAEVLLEDASQFILDTVPTAGTVSEATRRRVVCSVVRRSIEANQTGTGVESWQQSTGPFAATIRPVNPSGDFYLTKQEKAALGAGRSQAFGVQIADTSTLVHRPWCALMFGATYCSCGADIAGAPIYEAP